MRKLAPLIPIILISSCATVSRPGPNAPKEDWVKYCDTKVNCGLCTSEGNCGFCPTTNRCVYYSHKDMSAKTSCPAIVKTTEKCQ